MARVIVRPGHDALQLITQPDHAHLARRIMEHCAPLAARPRRDAILHAIGEHDNGWVEEDAAPIVNPSTGEVADFVHAPLSLRQGVWPRAVARLADDPWAAALVAQHAVTVYDRFRGDGDWTSFFAGMETARDSWLRNSGLALDDLVADYAFVRLGDLISLTFCAGWTTDQEFGGWTVQLSSTRVTVTPDLFAGTVTPIEISAREIPNRPFRSDADLRDALSQAVWRTLRGAVGGAIVTD
jgi:hypothetical protein